MKNHILLYLFFFLLTSCSSIEFMQVSIQKPAQMTLPLGVRNVTIVNNAVQQPSENIYIISGKDQEQNSMPGDSLNIVLTQALAQFMNEENFFERVQAYDQQLREDDSFLKESVIGAEKIQTIAKETDAEAIISLDRFITRSLLNKKRIYGTLFTVIEVKMEAKFRVYSHNGKLMNYPILFEDTLYWDNIDHKVQLPTQKEALRQAALHVADKMVSMFIPSWQEQTRWIYVEHNSAMKEAAKNAKESKWKEAVSTWGEVWETEKKPMKKAKIASNIAVANEMLDDVENAFNWIKIAYDLFYPERKKETVQEDFFRTEALKNELEQRVADLAKLNKQKGAPDDL